MYCKISPRRMCNPCGYTMKMSLRRFRHLINYVNRNHKIDGMGPFQIYNISILFKFYTDYWFYATLIGFLVRNYSTLPYW